MDFEKKTREMLAFIEKSPSCYHVIANVEEILKKEGFVELSEASEWKLQPGGKYYTTRGGSSIVAFCVPTADFLNYQIVASHSDSPSFKIKEQPEMVTDGHYVELNVERYGGMLCAPWFDRPLSVAGRVVVQEGTKIQTHLVDFDRDLVMIPNVAIHMNRKANDGYSYNIQKDMLPLLGEESAKGSFAKMIAEQIGVSEEAVTGTDLFLYNRVPGTIWGANREFVSGTKLDDLQCAFASLQGFLAGNNEKSVTVCAIFDNEEVGSTTKQGADSTFLSDVLLRINLCLGRTIEQYQTAIASSVMLSADNAHAVHPHHMDKADPTNRPYMNHGVVIKLNANQKYTTDAISAALFKAICGKAGVPYQVYVNRSDIAGGSTLGNISNAHVSLHTVDIGLAQLAMHSPYETAGVKDTAYLIQALTSFYGTHIARCADGSYELQ